MGDDPDDRWSSALDALDVSKSSIAAATALAFENSDRAPQFLSSVASRMSSQSLPGDRRLALFYLVDSLLQTERQRGKNSYRAAVVGVLAQIVFSGPPSAVVSKVVRLWRDRNVLGREALDECSKAIAKKREEEEIDEEDDPGDEETGKKPSLPELPPSPWSPAPTGTEATASSVKTDHSLLSPCSAGEQSEAASALIDERAYARDLEEIRRQYKQRKYEISDTPNTLERQFEAFWTQVTSDAPEKISLVSNSPRRRPPPPPEPPPSFARPAVPFPFVPPSLPPPPPPPPPVFPVAQAEQCRFPFKPDLGQSSSSSTTNLFIHRAIGKPVDAGQHHHHHGHHHRSHGHHRRHHHSHGHHHGHRSSSSSSPSSSSSSSSSPKR